MITALVAVLAAMSGLNVAQQEIAIELGASQGEVLWIINAYTVALAALLLPVGAIGDRFGRKPVLLAGLAVFAIATIGSVLATTTTMMIVARIIAGVGRGDDHAGHAVDHHLELPARGQGQGDRHLGRVRRRRQHDRHVRVGVHDRRLTWRWVFALPLVLVAVSAVMSALYVAELEGGHRPPLRHRRLGAVGARHRRAGARHPRGTREGLERPAHGRRRWSSAWSALRRASWCGSAADEPAARHQRCSATGGSPPGTVTLLIVFAVMFGVFLVLFPYFQAVLGWSALQSAAAMLPMTVVMMPMSTIAPKIANRIGSAQHDGAGVAIFAVGLVTLALRASVEGGYMSVLPGLLVIGLGHGLTMTPATAAITETLPAREAGRRLGPQRHSRELGGAVGIALLGSVLDRRLQVGDRAGLAGLPPELAEAASEGIGAAFAVAAKPATRRPAIIDAAKHAFVDGWMQLDVARRRHGRRRPRLPAGAHARRRPVHRRRRVGKAPTSSSPSRSERVDCSSVRCGRRVRCMRPVRSAHASNTSVAPGGTDASRAYMIVRPPQRSRWAATSVTAM